ncbi:heme o synthase [Chitinibacteraceae bacterium HSL-7]
MARTYALPLARRTEFWLLAKPKVVALITFCAAVGALLAQPGWAALPRVFASLLGIGLCAMGAAVVNCLVEAGRDAVMLRTQRRATATGQVTRVEAMAFAALLTISGLWLLLVFANALAAALTLATFIGYAIVYTRWLKPATPQNIVIGGAAGAMPPVLGAAAVTGGIDASAAVLFLIIYTWTPPHFWALAIYRRLDYQRAGLPMLPVTHGVALTQQMIQLYSVLLAAVSVLPLLLQMAGWVYAAVWIWANWGFCRRAWRLERGGDDAARALFRFSIRYLSLLFGAMLLDAGLMRILA